MESCVDSISLALSILVERKRSRYECVRLRSYIRIEIWQDNNCVISGVRGAGEGPRKKQAEGEGQRACIENHVTIELKNRNPLFPALGTTAV